MNREVDRKPDFKSFPNFYHVLCIYVCIYIYYLGKGIWWESKDDKEASKLQTTKWPQSSSSQSKIKILLLTQMGGSLRLQR